MTHDEYIKELTRWIAWLQNPTFQYATLDSWQRTKLTNTLKYALLQAVKAPEPQIKDGNNS